MVLSGNNFVIVCDDSGYTMAIWINVKCCLWYDSQYRRFLRIQSCNYDVYLEIHVRVDILYAYVHTIAVSWLELPA